MRDNERPLGDSLGVPTGSLAWGKGTLSIVAHAAGFFATTCARCATLPLDHTYLFLSQEKRGDGIRRRLYISQFLCGELKGVLTPRYIFFFVVAETCLVSSLNNCRVCLLKHDCMIYDDTYLGIDRIGIIIIITITSSFS